MEWGATLITLGYWVLQSFTAKTINIFTFELFLLMLCILSLFLSSLSLSPHSIYERVGYPHFVSFVGGQFTSSTDFIHGAFISLLSPGEWAREGNDNVKTSNPKQKQPSTSATASSQRTGTPSPIYNISTEWPNPKGLGLFQPYYFCSIILFSRAISLTYHRVPSSGNKNPMGFPKQSCWVVFLSGTQFELWLRVRVSHCTKTLKLNFFIPLLGCKAPVLAPPGRGWLSRSLGRLFVQCYDSLDKLWSNQSMLYGYVMWGRGAYVVLWPHVLWAV